jgi:hypothetical protein
MLFLPNGDARMLSKTWCLSGLRRPFHRARTTISADSLPFQFSEADEEPESDPDSSRRLASKLEGRSGPLANEPAARIAEHDAGALLRSLAVEFASHR